MVGFGKVWTYLDAYLVKVGEDKNQHISITISQNLLVLIGVDCGPPL